MARALVAVSADPEIERLQRMCSCPMPLRGNKAIRQGRQDSLGPILAPMTPQLHAALPRHAIPRWALAETIKPIALRSPLIRPNTRSERKPQTPANMEP